MKAKLPAIQTARERVAHKRDGHGTGAHTVACGAECDVEGTQTDRGEGRPMMRLVD